MEHLPAADAALTVTIALAAGIATLSLGRHLRIPGIVLLLGAGVLLGPDLWNLVHPDRLGAALPVLVSFAVSVILFEGAMNLNIRRLRREARIIRSLLVIGTLVTASGGALAARLLMGWSWSLSILFGTLVIVTGPTVITPLLRRIRIKRQMATLLEAEGVLIDAVGAVVGAAALQIVLSPTVPLFASGLLGILIRLGVGLAVGLAGGFGIAMLLRFRHLVPEGLENVFTLSLVLVLFQASNHWLAESGVMSVTAAGLVVGNLETPALRDLKEFKEQLTEMFIGMLFVLLAADVRLAEVGALGTAGLLTVGCLMVVVRPLNILLSTIGSGLSVREKVFLSWVAPRGIVAAGLASLAGQELQANGFAGGLELRALVFLVIASTVLVQGMSAGVVARLLGLRRAADQGYVILGANELGHELGRQLRGGGEEVLFLDSNPHACGVVEKDGFPVIYGNALEDRTLRRARVEERAGCLATTPNEEANLLFLRRVREEFKVSGCYLAIGKDQSAVTPDIVRKEGGRVLFGGACDLELWAVRLRRRIAAVESWSPVPAAEREKEEESDGKRDEPLPDSLLIPLTVERGDRISPVDEETSFRAGDRVRLALFLEREREAREALRRRGWEPAPEPERGEPPSTS